MDSRVSTVHKQRSFAIDHKLSWLLLKIGSNGHAAMKVLKQRSFVLY
jgi:hypothetical protein